MPEPLITYAKNGKVPIPPGPPARRIIGVDWRPFAVAENCPKLCLSALCVVRDLLVQNPNPSTYLTYVRHRNHKPIHRTPRPGPLPRRHLSPTLRPQSHPGPLAPRLPRTNPAPPRPPMAPPGRANRPPP